jgi:hypothetical protein
MGDFGLEILVILASIAVGIPILIGFRGSGRGKCWRCRVNMLPARKRPRSFPGLPLGQCEGCAALCWALGPHLRNRK